jgi:polysaccharide export outer membrane protein
MSTRHLLVAIAILLGWATQGSALAQYQFQPGDQIQISVWQEPRLDRQIVVAPDGSIALPLAGRIQAGGRTAAQVEQAIAGSLAAHYADELDVTVHLVGRPDELEEAPVLPAIYVMGEVTRPGEFPVQKPTTVLQAIALGGGLSPFAAERRIQVHRKVGGQDQIHVFDFQAFKHGMNPAGNIVLRPGDVVVVPERGLFE